MKLRSALRFHKITTFILVAVFFLGGCVFAGGKAASFYIKDGDRVVFYGDSITDQRRYTTFAESYIVTRFPKMNVTFTHSGWGGDRVTGGGGGPIDVRLERDVFAYKPTVMTVMLGMNDGRYKPFMQEHYDVYTNGYKHIISSVRAAFPKIRMTLIQASPYDDINWSPKFEGGYNATLVKYGEFVKKLAKENRLDVADLNAPVCEMLKKAKELNPELAQKMIPDRVHPQIAGALFLAQSLLKAWNAPSLVTSVEVDAKSGKVRAENSTVSDFQKGKTLAWKQLDNALPFPLDMKNAEIAFAAEAANLVETLDQEILKVASLDAASYILKIDGNEVGTFTKEQLAKGINLATLPTPMLQQAMEVHKLTWKRADKHNARWRGVQMSFYGEKQSPEVEKALQTLLDDMDKQVQELARQQREAAQPKPHQYELVPVDSAKANG